MVLIAPPDGWVLREEPTATPVKDPPARDLSVEKPPTPTKNGDSAVRRGVPAERETASEKPAVEPPPIQLPASASVEVAAMVAAPPVAPASAIAPVVPEAAPVATITAAAVVPTGFTPFELPEVVAGQTYLSALARSLWGRVAVLVVSGLLGLAGVLAVWMVVNRLHATDPKPNDANANVGPAAPLPADAGPKPALPIAQFNRRWLPEQTQLLIDLRMSRLSTQAMSSLALVGPWWQRSSQALLAAVNVGPEQVRRLTWAATDLADCAADCVVVLELEEGIDAGRQLPKGENIDLGANLVARRAQGGPWPHPLLAVDAHTIVTGSVEALRQLAARNGDAVLTDVSLELLLKKLSPGGDLAVLVDLSSARSAVGRSPAEWFDVWPAGKSRWHVLYETPLALGLSVPSGDQRRCDLGLVCKSETMAETIRSGIEKLVPDAIQALPSRIAALKGILPPDKFSGEACDQYKRLLDDLLAALRTARCDAGDGIVWLRFGWGGRGFLVSAATAIESRPAMRADWLAAARTVDESNHRGLLSGLLGYVKGRNPQEFPEGAAGNAGMLKPETRLSWIAGLLPYLGHADWHVDPGYDWNSAQNQATNRQLAEVVNPAFGPAVAPDGYPVTHYVGVAGVGENAAQLPADDPRAGLFGYGRQTRQQDLKRGGANTIAVLGVQDQCGPWAQGGRATVRSLTRQPYINGPDGFGSGQADGMVAGMADGSVRFLSKNIDPQVMEQLATVRGGDQVDVAALEPKPLAAEVKPPAVADVKPPAVADVKPPAVDVKPHVVDPKVQAKLDDPIAKMSLPNIPLADAVQLISAMSNLPVSFDPDAMEELGVSLHDPISIEVAKATVGKALEEIAAKRNLASVVENGQILLTSTADHRESLRPVRFAVKDLTGDELHAAADLAALVQRLVVPESWQQSGGHGTVEVTPDVLRITQTGHVDYQIIVFCEKLRVARGLPTKSRLDPKKFVLATRTVRAKAILGQIVSVNAGVPASLASILEQFKQPGEIFIDRPALAAIRADKLPLGEALRQLLEPLGLAWRAVDSNTLQITTQKAIAARMELEFYPVGKLLAGQPPAALIERIKTVLPGATWGEGGGAIYFDPPSQCLIVLQSQPVQRALEALLAEKVKVGGG